MSKVWLVTGSSRGLGRALAQAVLAAGHRLVATARSAGDLAFLPEGDRLRTASLDVTDAAAARAAVEVATSAFGRLDVVVNNAGVAVRSSIEDTPEEDFRRQVETNFFGVYNVTRAALPVMHAQRGGHIIQVSSIGGRRATPGLGAYQAAKWALGGFSEVLAREVAPLGIRVTCVEPGGMRTEMMGPSMAVGLIGPDYEATVGAVTRALRGQTPRGDTAKVAQAILRLAEEEQPPVRLLLGSDAVFLAGVAAAARAEEDARWRELSVSTDADGLGDFADTEAARALAKPAR